MFAGGSAMAAEPPDPGDPAPRAPNPTAREVRICSASSADSPTGRQYAHISPSSRNPDLCIRRFLGGDAPNTLPSCWAFKDELGCTTIIDE
jgi:hypothetical protein